jgi:hypothetical protein
MLRQGLALRVRLLSSKVSTDVFHKEDKALWLVPMPTIRENLRLVHIAGNISMMLQSSNLPPHQL